MSLPLSTRDAGDVQTEHGEGADHDHAGYGVNPFSEEGGENDGQRSGTEVESKLDRNARHHDVGCTANGKNDALQRASFRWGRVLPPPQTPTRSAFQRGWVGGRF
jgi:hypothetical protein